MRTKVAIVSTVFVLLSVCNVFAVPNLRLPFHGGEKWKCTQGTSKDPSNFVNGNETNQSHRSTNKMSYAWDFNFGSGNDDLGKPVVASASGIIIYAQMTAWGWGNVVIIDYGDGSYGKVAHLDRIDVAKGNYVHQGQQVGTCGGTGGWSPHIHYQTQNSGDPNGQSIPSLFIDADVAKHNGIPLYTYSYISDNYLLICWDFNTTGWDENWTRTNIENYSVGGGILYIDPGLSDPYITSPPISVSAVKSALIISMASNAPDGVGAIYFTTSSSPNWDEDKKVSFSVINDGDYYRYCIPMGLNSSWKDIITRIRVDPANKGISYTNVDTIGIDFISIVQLDWDFNTAGNREGWTMCNIANYSVGNGVFYIDPYYSDPYVVSPPITKNANEFIGIFIRMASNAIDGSGAIYFTTSSSPNWNEDKKVEFTAANDGKYYNYFIPMQEHSKWKDIITGIRIDPANKGIKNSNSDTIGIDCIAIY